MKKTTKTVLFSILILPGSGHFLLRRWLRGLIFVVPVLLAFGYYLNYSVDQALITVDRIMSGEVSPDSASIHAMLDEQSARGKNTLLIVSKTVLLVGWLAAAIDVYLIAKKETRSELNKELGNL